MNSAEVEAITIDWAAKEGWNPGLHDAQCFCSVDHNAFFVGLLDNEPVACISAVAYDNEFGFLGFYIVKPEFRGKGYGLKVWNAALEHLNTRNIGLDSVLAQQSNYEKSGFKFAHRNIRFEGIASQITSLFPQVVRLREEHIDEISEYDRQFFPADRTAFLRSWIRQSDSLGFVFLYDETVKGYCCIRTCMKGYKIGPLFANDVDIARSLYLSVCNYAPPGSLIYLNVPEVNSTGLTLAKELGMHRASETARLYKGAIPDIDLHKVYGITSVELG